mmetsp:Transcript_56438/g.125994  ORF Transcript_56438/g.125994 Transcript_56438/m.125994 type:complete len:120 (-) Transcript_56438:221-580(-)
MDTHERTPLASRPSTEPNNNNQHVPLTFRSKCAFPSEVTWLFRPNDLLQREGCKGRRKKLEHLTHPLFAHILNLAPKRILDLALMPMSDTIVGILGPRGVLHVDLVEPHRTTVWVGLPI